MTLQKTPARLKAQRPMPEYCSAIENRDRDALDNVFASDAVIEYIVMVRVKRPVQEIRAFLAQSSSRMKVAETRRPSASNTAGLPLRGLGVADVGVEAPVHAVEIARAKRGLQILPESQVSLPPRGQVTHIGPAIRPNPARCRGILPCNPPYVLLRRSRLAP